MDSTVGQYYINIKKLEQNDFVDVCSTENLCYEDKENNNSETLQSDIHKSPIKKSYYFF